MTHFVRKQLTEGIKNFKKFTGEEDEPFLLWFNDLKEVLIEAGYTKSKWWRPLIRPLLKGKAATYAAQHVWSTSRGSNFDVEACQHAMIGGPFKRHYTQAEAVAKMTEI